MITTIKHYNRRTEINSDLLVEKIDDHTFRLVESDPFDVRYFTGDIIETSINAKGCHETIKFIRPKAKPVQYILTVTQSTSDLQILLDELHRLGGHWQIDMGGIVSLTVPDDFPYDIDEVIKNMVWKL